MKPADWNRGEHMNRVAFMTLGCKTNQYETDALMDLFYKNRFEITSFDDIADIYIINTCTVTHVGDKKSRQMIRRARKNNPDSIVVVMGCYAQISTDEVSEIEEVDIVIGTDSRGDILKYIETYKSGIVSKPYVVVEDIMAVKTFEDMSLQSIASHTRAFIKIQEGCNQYCSYCIIPYARGHVRSRSVDSIIKEIELLASKGYKEFVLTGIHIGSYGIDLKHLSLIDLLESIHSIEGVERIRLGSVEPRLIDTDFIERLAKLPKVCDHFHLSMQSGSDSVLKRMNRKYTTAQYEQAVSALRSIYDNPSITTDVIVGFPGETDEEFNETLNFINHIDFSEMHIFPFSKREGTPAATMDHQVDGSIKKQRAETLGLFESKNREAYINSNLGGIKSVLIEEKKDGEYVGHTTNYLKIHIQSEQKIQSGSLINVMLKKDESSKLIGVIVP